MIKMHALRYLFWNRMPGLASIYSEIGIRRWHQFAPSVFLFVLYFGLNEVNYEFEVSSIQIAG